MGISNWLITGDTHGDFSRFYKLNSLVPEGETWGVIILGDAGVNFWLSKRDKKLKYSLGSKYPRLRFYLVRGNHEERPENLEDTERVADDDVKGVVYMEPQFPHIRYFIDGYEYWINGYRILTIGGAYSIDKWYRLERESAGGYGGWFKQEQLSHEEMIKISDRFKGQHFDLVLSHTCPFSWEPRDLFLSFIDQTKVDKAMELWMETLKEDISWSGWACGHFHDDRTLAPHAQMLFMGIKQLDDLMEELKK